MRPKAFLKVAFRSLSFRRDAFHDLAFHTAAVLLLGMTVASTMNAADMGRSTERFSPWPSAYLASQPAPTTGCHSHALPASLPLPVVPATVPPAPRSYECCVTGHHAAIPFASFSLRLVFACVGEATGAEQFSLATTVHSSSIVLISAFGSPPGSFSLRI
jgi:hypothetical protein